MGRYDSLVIDKLISRGGRWQRAAGGGGGGGAASHAPVLLSPADADYTTGSGLSWGASGDAMTIEIDTASTIPDKPSELMGWKFWDTGFTIADLPQLHISYTRTTSPTSYQNKAPLLIAGFIIVPSGTTPSLSSHPSRTFVVKFAFNSGKSYGWGKVRADGNLNYSTLSVDTSPENFGLQCLGTLVSQQRVNGDKVTTFWVCTACYPGSNGAGTERSSKSDNTLITPSASDKVYACVGAGRANSGGSGTLTIEW